MTASEPFSLAGIPIEGAQAQLGRLVTENILYAATIKQVRKTHRTYKGNGYDCACKKYYGSGCPTLLALSNLDDVSTSM